MWSGARLPRNIVIGYWENWVVGGVKVYLRDVNPCWDVVNVSFMLAQDSTCTFTPSNASTGGDLYAAGAAGVRAFKQDVRFLQSRGQKVVISFGGAGGYDYQIDTAAQRDTFLNSAIAIIEEYGFDGLDIDIEADLLNVTGETSFFSPTKPSNINLVYILRQIKRRFGCGFILSMTPEHPYVQGGSIVWGGWRDIFGGYLPVLQGVRDILTYVAPQYYNNPINEYPCLNGYNVNSLVGLTELLLCGFSVPGHGYFNGLRPDQVALTVKQSGAGGALSLAEYQEAFSQLLARHPALRGISVWSINQQIRSGVPDAFVCSMRGVIDRANIRCKPPYAFER